MEAHKWNSELSMCLSQVEQATWSERTFVNPVKEPYASKATREINP
jgi:hypothetical protein